MTLFGKVMLGLAMCLGSPTWAADIVIIDGDTLELSGTRFRIHGIDAPEAGQKCSAPDGGRWNCGAAAIDALEQMVLSASVLLCEPGPLDDYGRMISVCTADGDDIGRALVSAGLAWSYVKFAHDYDAEEVRARADGLGVWRAPTEPAWEYRAHRWDASRELAPNPDCPIKGNINSEGERIYHTPWSPVYDRTKISVEHGERWFCNEAEAIGAGWRVAYWGHAARR
jgi:endonuclease YncB( thermonuclease family)